MILACVLSIIGLAWLALTSFAGAE